MRFFLDENVNQQLATVLAATFLNHSFIGVKDLGTKGLDDIPLFPRVAGAGCIAIVTHDFRQLQRPAEREACRGAELHWIGVHQFHRGGLASVSDPTSALIHAMPFVLQRIEEADRPLFFRLKKPERSNGRVFTTIGGL